MTVYATGFEARSKGIIPAADVLDDTRIFIDSSNKNTGASSLAVEKPSGTENWVRFPYSASVNEAWFSVYFNLRGAAKEARVEFFLSDGNTVGFRVASGGGVVLDAYVGGSKVANGSTNIDVLGYALLEAHVLVSGSGELDLSINGAVEHAYTGSTQPGASSTISYLRFYIDNTSTGDEYNIDDLTMSETSAPGDLTYLRLQPNGDNSTSWTPDSGATNYTQVDEAPPDDGDYVESSSDGDQDLYTLSNIATSNVVPHIVQWIRSKTSVGGNEVKMQIKVGDTTSEQSTSGLGASFEYAYRVLTTNPATGSQWYSAVVNNLLIGQESDVSAGNVQVSQNVIEYCLGDTIVSPISFETVTKYVEDQGGGASGGAGGGFDNMVDISADAQYLYICAFDSDSTPILIRFSALLDADGTIVFDPGAGGRIGVRCGRFNASHVWVAGEFDGTNTVEKSENDGGSFVVKDDGTFGTIRTFDVGPDSDNRLLLFDGDNGDILETTDGGDSWTTINGSVSPLINSLARLDINLEEIIAGNQGAVNNSINYSPNSGVDLEDYQTGVYPNADATKVIEAK